MTRLTHFSDIHLTASPLGWRPRDFLSKRVTGWVNVKLLGRGHRFRHATTVATAFLLELSQRHTDGVLFTGDATKMAFEAEFREVDRVLRPQELGIPGIAVPGNHDYYTHRAARAGTFEKWFASWLVGERIGEEIYPFCRTFADVHVIAVNSCTPNRIPFDAAGSIGIAQLERLKTLCARLDDRPKIVMTHYPLRTASGKREHRTRRLRDADRAIRIAQDCGIRLWLHGHIHKGYVRAADAVVPFPTICSGSTTQTERWSYNEYEIETGMLRGLRRRYEPAMGTFVDGERFELALG